MIRSLRLMRPLCAARPSSALLWSVAMRPLPLVRCYSDPASDIAAVDSELVTALRNEHRIENEAEGTTTKDDDSYFKGFLQTHGFELVSKPGTEEVQLLRANGAETIRIFFSVSDVMNSDSILDEAEPEVEQDVRAEQEVDADYGDDFDAPIRLNIVVEKPAGAIGFEAVIQDDAVLVESIIPYKSGALATDESAEADYLRRQTYQGPPFSVLDPTVQAGVQQFLEARGIDSDLALFVAEYSSFRENQEYLAWLARLADIIDS